MLLCWSHKLFVDLFWRTECEVKDVCISKSMIFLVPALYYRECVLVSKTEVNYNTYVFRLQLPRGSVRHVPVGQHVYLKANVQGKRRSRQAELNPFHFDQNTFPAMVSFSVKLKKKCTFRKHKQWKRLLLLFEVGAHYHNYFNLLDTEVVRPYTPVDQSLSPSSSSSSQESDLYLMIKVYPDGVLTPYVNNLQIGK